MTEPRACEVVIVSNGKARLMTFAPVPALV
jgi:hypothetical protein